MKKYIIYGLALALGMGMAACNEDFAEPPIVLPEGGVGTGDWNNPMTAYQALIGSVNDNLVDTVTQFNVIKSGNDYKVEESTVTQAKNPWVKGYIVGYINVNISNTLSAACAEFDPTGCTVSTNLLIAVDSLETNWENCATVQLPSGAVRSALNLQDHPENWRKLVCIQGETGSKYCGAYGVRSTSSYNWGSEGLPATASDVQTAPYLYEDFDSSDKIASYTSQGWQNIATAGGLDGWYIKTYSGQNYITVSAFKGSAAGGPYENWLISPPVDLDKSNSKTLNFITQAAYPAEDSILEVYALTTTDFKPQLVASIAVPPTSGSTYSSWVDSGEIDLSAYSGVVYIGWRYYSAKGGDGYSSTYCLDNVNIGGAPKSAK